MFALFEVSAFVDIFLKIKDIDYIINTSDLFSPSNPFSMEYEKPSPNVDKQNIVFWLS